MMRICITRHLSNIWSSIHKRVKQQWGWKKALLIKRPCVLLLPLATPVAVGVKVYLIYFLFRREFEVAFALFVKKSVFLLQISWILKLGLEGWPL